MSGDNARRRGLPASWMVGGLVMLVLLVSFAGLVVHVHPLRVQPPWLAWLAYAGLLVLGLSFGLVAAPVFVDFWWPMLVVEAEHHGRTCEGPDEERSPRVPEYGRSLGPFLSFRNVTAGLAPFGAAGIGLVIEFMLTGKVQGSGACLTFVGFGIGYAVIPLLWMTWRLKG